MLAFADIKSSFDALELQDKPVIAHASLKPFGYIQNGADAILRVMLGSFKSVLMPTFTYKTMITPEVGPPNNGIKYGTEKDLNKMAIPFTSTMPADKTMGIIPEALRNHPSATRTSHPILSFTGVKSEEYLNIQTLYEPLAPIGALADAGGWVILLNVDHSVNTSIHYGEKLAGRMQFLRWAMVENRIVECPGFPGDSTGFNTIEEYIKPDTRRANLGNVFIQAIPLKRLFDAVGELIKKDPLALLCQRHDCDRCDAVKKLYPVG